MKFTLSWLKDHLETEASLEEISDTLTMIGLEVEAIDNPADKFAPFTVAYVESAEQHPDADRLRVCMVNTGTETVQVVCGAPNARAGMKGVFAPSGTTIPGTGLHLTPTKIRGVESNGMLVSEREMGISDDHEGIIDVDEKFEVGTPFAGLMGLDDPVIEIAITPNRPDCLGVYGIARDLTAAGIGKLKGTPVPQIPKSFDSDLKIELRFEEAYADACSAFSGRLVRGVKNGPSPDWVQRRLRAIGLRPINALVDITNYISYDRGRPLHVYDAAKVTGTLHARMGQKGEKFLALDGKAYEADGEMCVIADDSCVLGLGGIMGGEASGCTEATTDVIIESALFDPVRTAMTGRRTGINSDARYRFERGVDPAFCVPGIEQATQMVMDLCGGEPGNVVVAGDIEIPEKVVEFPVSEVKRLTGIDMQPRETKAILGLLGFWVAGTSEDDIQKVAVPSWRPDIVGKADLVEEVVRIFGVDRVEAVALPRLNPVTKPVLTTAQRRRFNARRALAARGMAEAVTWSFISHDQAVAFGGGGDELVLANPISSEMSDMRPGLLPGLIMAAQRNADRGYPDSAIFEIGPAYRGAGEDEQYTSATGIRRATNRMTGSGRHWAEITKPVDALDAKADALAALAAAGAPIANLQVWDDAPGWYHPGRSGALKLGPKTILAWFGEIHPGILDKLDVEGPVVGFEVLLDNIPASRGKSKTRAALDASDLQPVKRDFAFVLSGDVPASDVVRAAKGVDKTLITDVSIFDLFEGTMAEKALGAGNKSLAIEVTLQPRQKTMTDEEIDAVAAKIVVGVEKATGGRLRG